MLFKRILSFICLLLTGDIILSRVFFILMLQIHDWIENISQILSKSRQYSISIVSNRNFIKCWKFHKMLMKELLNIFDFRNIYRKTPALESLFNKVAALNPTQNEPFWGCSRIGGGKKPPLLLLLHISCNDETLAQVHLT